MGVPSVKASVTDQQVSDLIFYLVREESGMVSFAKLF
jgi:hypothetical protein